MGNLKRVERVASGAIRTERRGEIRKMPRRGQILRKENLFSGVCDPKRHKILCLLGEIAIVFPSTFTYSTLATETLEKGVKYA